MASSAAGNNNEDALARLQSRFARRLRVVTEPKHSNKMHRTRTLSELILLSSPRSSMSPRVTPRHNRFDMDIEVSSFFADGEGVVDILEARRRNGFMTSMSSSTSSIVEETAPGSRSSDFDEHEDDDEENNQETHENRDEDEPMNEPENEPLEEIEPEPMPEPAENAHSVGQVIDMLFEIHSALKTRHLGQRTAASALAASNLVSTLAYPTPEPIPRDEQLETMENTRKMLECAICQEVFTSATEATCCGQIFCKDCIERWVSERGSCPMCRESIGFSLLVASRHAQRMANEMKVSCPYCSESMKKAGLADHMTTCDMAPVEPPPPADVAIRNLLVSTARLNMAFLSRFLMAPSPPQALMMQCYIRTRGGGNYELYTQDTDTLLCTAVRRRQYDMSVSFSIYLANNLENDRSNQSSTNATQVARLEKNYMGSQYTMFDTTGEQPVELGAVQYAATFGKSPRQMRVALPLVQEIPEVDSSVDGAPSWEVQPWTPSSKDDTILAQVENPADPTKALHLINKPPVWIESLEAYCLDFGGRVAAASVKNFLLSHPDDMDKTLMLFGRTQDRQVYSMDYSHPFTPVQAFAIALSSMDSHLVTFD
ncbi:Tubby-like protein, partial [Globisporangium splendens]